MANYMPFYFPDGRLAFTVPLITYDGEFPTVDTGFMTLVPHSALSGFNWQVTIDSIIEIIDFDIPTEYIPLDEWPITSLFATDFENGIFLIPGTINGHWMSGQIINGQVKLVDYYGVSNFEFGLDTDHRFKYLVVVFCVREQVFLLLSTDPYYNTEIIEDTPTSWLGLFTNDDDGVTNPKPTATLVDYSYLYGTSGPPNPDDIVDLRVEPQREYGYSGEEIQYKAFYVYKDESEIEAADITWGLTLSPASLEVSESVDGASIDDTGLVKISGTGEHIFIYVRATSKSLSKEDQVILSVDWTYTPLPGGDGGYLPNPGNQYYPGGTSGGSGVPQGSYDNTFGPNASSLIPGLDSSGNSTGQGGAVGNDISLSGMYTKYLMNQQYLNTLAQFFWEDNVGIQALKLAFGNPIDSIISLISYPFNLDLRVPTVQQNIFFGKYDSQFPGRAISRSSFQIDWGTIPIDFYWGNFLDYAPYTQVQLYLPWGVGFVSIDPNEVMPYSNVPNDFNPVNYNKGSIRVVTNIELDKGACVHNVIGNRGLVIGSYGGVVGKQIPMTALDQSAKMLALLGAASGIGMAAGNAMAGAATGKYTSVTPKYSTVGYGGNKWVQSLGFEHKFEGGQMLSDMGSSKAMRAGLASAAALASTPPNYPRAGTFSDATNTMCAQVPYIIISRPSQSVPQNYGHYNGYPSNIYYNKLSMVSGYTEISEIHLDNVPGSVEELEELDSMLKGGVLL